MQWELVSDAELSRQCRQDRPEAWRELIRRCAPTAYRVALQTLRNTADAEDACQEAFMKMHRAFDTFDPTRPLRPWAAKITYNVCMRRREGVINRATDLVEPGSLQDQHAGAELSPEDAAARTQAHAQLSHAMAALDPEDRALLVLRYREGLSDPEVADAADMPVNTVKTRIFRARARLKKLLGAMMKGDEA